jgi:hypothetical protein
MTCLSSACGPQFEDPMFIEASCSTVIEQRVVAMQYPPVRVENAAPGCAIRLPYRVMSLAFVCHTRVVPGSEVVPSWQQLERHTSRETSAGIRGN